VTTAISPTPTPALAQPQTARQHARRDGALLAAFELAEEGGYEAVRMREVAERAGIALGTLYRYFGSKDHLLASAMAQWSTDLRGRVEARPPNAGSPVEQVIEVMRRAARALERRPQLSEALVKSLFSHDTGVAEANHEVSRQIHLMLSPPLQALDDDTRDGLIDLIAQVWHSALIGWANGRFPIDEIGVKMQRAVRLILEPRFP